VPVAEWMAAPVPDAAAELERAGFPPWLAALLARRGVADAPGAERFLEPSLDQLHDPFLLAGMSEAVERLMAARAGHERIAIVGDYDVDGVTATALLLAVLGACGCDARPVLPHRLREGYGFQPVHVERAVAAGCSVIYAAPGASADVDGIRSLPVRHVREALGWALQPMSGSHRVPKT